MDADDSRSPDLRARDARMLSHQAAAELRAAGVRESTEWHEIQSRAQWEQFRDERMDSLRRSLGPFPAVPSDLRVQVTGKIRGEGFQIENLVFESRPGLLVTANLYRPIDPPSSMPGILLCHSHHAPKWDEELQDMAMTWAQRGCTVLVIDLLGHGERRQHPFATDTDYPGPFKIRRQDYYFRYNLGLQLQLVGQSLTGWIAWDLMRGADLLLARPGVDPTRIILLGSVASGGDLAAVTGALDRRIAAVGEFNFGGPQPETRYPLRDDAETSFDYVGGGSWESTRNLIGSAHDGFLPWVIVGSIAPRCLIYGHEFSWDQPHDPVWARLQRIYGFYDVPRNLSGVHGRGLLSGHPPEASHANNIGPVQLQGIYPALEKWFGISTPAEGKTNHRNYSSKQLTCLTPEVEREREPRPVWKLASELGEQMTRAGHEKLGALAPAARPARLRELWHGVLGEIDPQQQITTESRDDHDIASLHLRRVVLRVEPDVTVPVLLLSKRGIPKSPPAPIVVAVAQDGHRGFLRHRATTLARLIEDGVTVCLPDLRGTGDTALADTGRGRTSEATDLSASYLMLGRPLLGQRLRDLRSVVRYLRSPEGGGTGRIALWGDSFAPPNASDARMEVPSGADPWPTQSEPMGGIVVLLAGLFEPDVVAVSSNGGLGSYQSIVESPFCYLPYDVIVPNLLATGDLPELAAGLAPRALRISGSVDGQNRALDGGALDRTYARVHTMYHEAEAPARLHISNAASEGETSAWLLNQLHAD